VKRDVPRGATLRLELVLCGKPKCDRPHGPYWYACFKERGRWRKVYIGRELPPELARRRVGSRRRSSKDDPKVLEVLELDAFEL
jgi:hypothetical protein